MNVTLFGNSVFADGQFKMKSLGWVSAQENCVLIKRGNFNMEAHTQGKYQVKIKTEISMVHP